jgi:hypothetical protein
MPSLVDTMREALLRSGRMILDGVISAIAVVYPGLSFLLVYFVGARVTSGSN